MSTVDAPSNDHLTGQDWLWIILIAIVASVATFGGFVLFLPAYVLALATGYAASRKFPRFFHRANRALFVLKILSVVVPVFVALAAVELWWLPSAQ